MKYLIILSCILLLQCKTTNTPIEEGVQISALPGDMNQTPIGRISVNLQPDITIEEIVADYSAYKLNSKSIMSKTENKWLCTFDRKTISDKELVKLLNSNDYIIKAEILSNKKSSKSSFKSSKILKSDPTRD